MPLYQLFGRILKEHFPGWKGIFLTSSADLARSTAVKADKINTLYNGTLSCTAMAFTLFSREERTALAERELPPLSPGAQMFANRLKKNLKHRGKWARRRDVTSYRLYDADMPEYSVALDFYEGTWVHLQEYAPRQPSPPPRPRSTGRRSSRPFPGCWMWRAAIFSSKPGRRRKAKASTRRWPPRERSSSSVKGD